MSIVDCQLPVADLKTFGGSGEKLAIGNWQLEMN